VRVIGENEFCRMAGLQPPEDLKQQYYGQRDLLSMYPGLREDHLRYLQKWGLIRPVMRTHTETYYPFSDLLTIRHVSSELASAPFRTILRSLQAERSGQLTFDFRIDAEPARIIKLKRPKAREIGKEPGKETVVPMAAPQTLAEEYFTKASALDVDESRHNAAATWYRKALEIDPYLVPAIINLANIHYGKDELAEAQALYERAIGLDPDFFEAHFNLGNIYHDLGRFKEAAGCYRTALRPQQPICRRALLPGDHTRKDRALTRGEAPLARVSDALAGRRMGRAGEGILRIEPPQSSKFSIQYP
jgi:tetratricopeptide (TPR) repeat protein